MILLKKLILPFNGFMKAFSGFKWLINPYLKGILILLPF